MNYQVLKQEIQVAESLEYARLTTYLLDITPKFAGLPGRRLPLHF